MAPQKLTLTLEAELAYDPDRTKNHIFMKFADCIATFTVDEKELGNVGGTLGAGYELHDEESGLSYYIGPRIFWSAFQEALKNVQPLSESG